MKKQDNERRCFLIDREIYFIDGLTKDEKAELDKLQKQMEEESQRLYPLPNREKILKELRVLRIKDTNENQWKKLSGD